MIPFSFQPSIRKEIKKVLQRFGFNTGHWVRAVMYQECGKLLEDIGASNLDVLEISGDIHDFISEAKLKSYKQVSHPEFDICRDRLSESFDLIIADQVFEHLLWPYRAGKNVYEMLRPGGYFLIMTPFLVRIHLSPEDCTRWTAQGLKYFLAECGFPLENIRSAGWGNRACVKANFNRWARTGWGILHSLKNEKRFPVTVWALARKPLLQKQPEF